MGSSDTVRLGVPPLGCGLCFSHSIGDADSSADMMNESRYRGKSYEKVLPDKALSPLHGPRPQPASNLACLARCHIARGRRGASWSDLFSRRCGHTDRQMLRIGGERARHTQEARSRTLQPWVSVRARRSTTRCGSLIVFFDPRRRRLSLPRHERVVEASGDARWVRVPYYRDFEPIHPSSTSGFASLKDPPPSPFAPSSEQPVPGVRRV